jgi:hypothetical protein
MSEGPFRKTASTFQRDFFDDTLHVSIATGTQPA